MADAPVLGIDLGTTNSVVSVVEDGNAKVLRTSDNGALIPSIVSFHPSGDVLVGHAAKDRRLLDAENTVYSVKRLIGRPYSSYEVQQAQTRFAFELAQGPTGGVLVAARGETYTLSEISAFVLRQVRRTAEQALGVRSGQAVITVPANFNELQRSATKAAGRVAGLEVLRILNEPTAAALAYGYGKTTNERLAVYDLGGGTFDVTILQLSGDVFEVLATAGDTFLGGDDVDIAIADDMVMRFLEETRYDIREDRQAYERLRAASEWAKCQVSKKSKVKLCMEELAYGDGGKALDLNYELTREKLEQMARPLLGRTFDVCEDAMRVAGVRPTQLDNVILVGGSTRIPLLQSMVAEYFGRKPLVTIDPDLVVAQGAALQAALLTGTGRKATLGKVALKRVHRQKTAAKRPAIVEDDLDERDTDVPAVPPMEQPTVSPEPSVVERLSTVAPEPEIVDALAAKVVSVDDDLPDIHVADLDTLLPEIQTPDLGLADPTPTRAPTPVPRRPVPPTPVSPISSESKRRPAPPPVPVPVAAVHAVDPVTETPTVADASAVEMPTVADAPVLDFPDIDVDLPLPDIDVSTAPLLLDVTPLSLGVETVDGYCEHIIERNAAIPAQQTKMFTTARDEQESVAVRICQGESRRITENQELGEVVLEGLRKAPRGEVEISVTFVIDSDGTLNVRAEDVFTGREQAITIKLIGELPDNDVAALQARHEEKFGD